MTVTTIVARMALLSAVSCIMAMISAIWPANRGASPPRGAMMTA